MMNRPLHPSMIVELAAVSARIRDQTDKRVLLVSPHEQSAIVAGLRKYRTAIRVDMRKQARLGWKPEPGCRDNNVLRMETVERLLARYGDKGVE